MRKRPRSEKSKPEYHPHIQKSLEGWDSSGPSEIQLVIAPSGGVKETKVTGGHPILVNAALVAVKKWKFETVAAESTETVELNFRPPE